MITKKEIKRQLKALWRKSDEIEKTSNEATSLAKYASDGFKDLYKYYKDVKEDNEGLKTDITTIKEQIPKIKEGIDLKLSKNLMWTLGFIFGLLSVYTAIIIFITNSK